MAQRIDCSEILDLIPDYAFGLTDEATTRRVEAALPACPDAAHALADFRRLQDDMRESVAQTEPPPALANRLRDAIRAASPSAPVPPRSTFSTYGHGTIAPDLLRYQTDTRPPNPQAPTRPPRRLPRTLPLIAAAAALIALVITNVYWLMRVNTLSTQMHDVTTLLAQFENETFSVRDANSLELARLSGDDDGAFAMMMWNKESHMGLIYTRDFPQTEAGKVYQLWLLRGDTRVSGGTFTVPEDGESAMIFHAPDDITTFEAAGITEEPEGGSDAPTSTPVVSGAL